MGNHFCKFRGFPKLSPCNVTYWEFLLKTSVITVEYCSPDGPFRNYYSYNFSLVIICLYLTGWDKLISKKTIVIRVMCKLSFKSNLSVCMNGHQNEHIFRSDETQLTQNESQFGYVFQAHITHPGKNTSISTSKWKCMFKKSLYPYNILIFL